MYLAPTGYPMVFQRYDRNSCPPVLPIAKSQKIINAEGQTLVLRSVR